MAESDPRRRVLLVDYQLLATDVADALQRCGLHVRRISPRGLTAASLGQALGDLRPAFLLSINYSPELAFLSGRFGTPYVSWTIDPLPRGRVTRIDDTVGDRCLCFVHQRELGERLRGLGFAAVEYLPLAAAARRRAASGASNGAAPPPGISFVGNSLRSEAEALDRAVEAAGFDPSLRTRLERWLAERADEAGHNLGVGALRAQDLPSWLPVASADDAETWAERLSGGLASMHRANVVIALESLDVAVYGDEGWKRVARGYRGLADHGDELTRIYRQSAVNLDVPRLYQRQIVTMRAFDVMAAGGMLLTERGGELEQLVSADCLVTYAGTDELVERARELVRHPARAREVARAGHECVVREHLIEHRVANVVERCRQRGWLG